MTAPSLTYIVCYDVENDRRRARVAQILESYGERIQYSVFEVSSIGKGDLQRLTHDLRECCDAEDKIFFFLLTAASKKGSFSVTTQPISSCKTTMIV